ncbi:protein-tyrosine phosphatase [Cerasibacillus quisquiliarum]|uniref:Tyrosine-protein phosphatase n=1 Tax=Cerasibacillus quisquiliarum TaxID=227865 RepID=A0A511UU94_9BACI|nr:CpsB/CapC family capsule biosynthesis tyrosine phosphatase [Cerasibacillus quisquiliarum]MBB5144957.1 protein-tyrosine phosphatase [Cerasibacillus quisquiliarum]GEN30147.1 tyrosine protein phosphatase [Cerasibacillus quisquiliarum]
MIDIHSHILPGVDDGAQTEIDSIEMAHAAVQQGIHTIIATPHHMNGQYENEKQSIIKHVELLNELLESENIPLTVLPGQEIRIYGELLEDLQQGTIQSLNNTKYIFIEFPSGHVPRYAEQMLFDIQVAGYIPIIVHPERNRELSEQPNKLYEFVRKGALTQVTAASVIGKFGKTIQKFTEQIIEANLAHFIASDAHNTTSRGFCMKEAYQEIEKLYGLDMTYMFLENGEYLILGENINKYEPKRITKKKRFLGLF